MLIDQVNTRNGDSKKKLRFTPARPLLVSLNEGFSSIGIGRTKGYELVNAGILKTVVIGKRRFIKVSSLRALAETGTEG